MELCITVILRRRTLIFLLNSSHALFLQIQLKNHNSILSSIQTVSTNSYTDTTVFSHNSTERASPMDVCVCVFVCTYSSSTRLPGTPSFGKVR